MISGGLLGDCQPSGEPVTEFVADAESEELYRLIEAPAKAERDRAATEDLDQFMRGRLWQKYQEHIEALDKLEPATLAKYQKVFAEFAESCAEAGVSCLPATPGAIATYLDHKLSNGASAETIRCIAAAIAVAHEAFEYRDPTTALLVRGIVRAARTYKRNKPNGKAH